MRPDAFDNPGDAGQVVAVCDPGETGLVVESSHRVELAVADLDGKHPAGPQPLRACGNDTADHVEPFRARQQRARIFVEANDGGEARPLVVRYVGRI